MSKNKKGFIFVLPSAKSGGGNRISIMLAEGVAEAGHNVVLECANNSEEVSSYFKKANLRKHFNGKISNNILVRICNMIKTLQYIKKNYDKNEWFIVYSDPILAIFAFIISAFSRIRFVQGDDYNLFNEGSNGLPSSSFLKIIILRLYMFLTKCSYSDEHLLYLFNSNFSYQAFIKISALKNIEKRIVYPAINLNSFYNLKQRHKENFSLLTIGRKSSLKGFRYFIQAVQELRRLIRINNIFVLSQDDLSSYDLDGITLVRPQDDKEINDYYNKATIYICTSEKEGFGLPALEAMSAGCCLITSDTDGAKEYGIDGKNCLIYNAGNVEELKERILQLYHDRASITKLASAGLLTAQLFSVEKTIKKFLKSIDNY